MAVITLYNGPTTLTPVALSEFKESLGGGPLVHPILGKRKPDVTMRSLGLRTGSFTLDFSTEARSAAAVEALGVARVWMLRHDDAPTLNMEFVVTGVTREVDGSGRWPVSVEFEEIS